MLTSFVLLDIIVLRESRGRELVFFFRFSHICSREEETGVLGARDCETWT